MSEQRAVYEAVVKRGYREGWTDQQFIARQVCKLQEELAELSQHARDNLDYDEMDSDLEFSIRQAGKRARALFDNKEWWINAGLTRCEKGDIESAIDGLKKELADVQVVVFCLAEEINRMTD